MMADPNEPTAKLIRSAREGSRPALGLLLESFRPMLLAQADDEMAADLRAKAGPSDVVQQSFLKAQRAFDGFRGASPGELAAWLQAILRTTLTDFVREYHETAKRDPAREARLSGVETAARGPSPSQLACRNEQAERLRRAIERLSAEQQEVIRLRHREGRSFAEVGAAVGKSEEAARKVWGRAVDELREIIASDERDSR